MEENLLRLLVILFGIAVVAIILVQQPKEGGLGAFGGGGGASASVFGAKGATSFFFKLTAVLITLFIIIILSLVKVSNTGSNSTLEFSKTTEVNKVDPVNLKQSEVKLDDIKINKEKPSSE